MGALSTLRDALFPLHPHQRQDLEHAIDEELHFHLEMRAREYEKAGAAADVAWQKAQHRFGFLPVKASPIVNTWSPASSSRGLHGPRPGKSWKPWSALLNSNTRSCTNSGGCS